MIHYPASLENTAFFPLIVPDGYFPTGIADNIALFENGEGTVRRVELPLYEQARCNLSTMRIMIESGPESIPLISVSPHGSHVVDLSIEGANGVWWLVIRAEPFQ